MAISAKSKILASDISTALAGKQNVLGYTPVKSVNGTVADSAGNVSLSVSAPVTSVNGMTGAVTISSVPSSEAVSGVYTYSADTNKFTLPSGGTWGYFMISSNYEKVGTVAGGSTISINLKEMVYVLAVRKS